MTGAQQVHDKVLAKVHDDKVRDKVHDTAARGVGGAVRHKHAHGTTRHSSLEQMSERRTRAQKGTATCWCHPMQVPSPPVQRRHGDDDTAACTWRRRGEDSGAVSIPVRMRRRGDAEG